MKASYKDRGMAWLLRWCSTLLARSGQSALASLFYRTADDLSPVDSPPFDYALALWQNGQSLEATSVLEKILAATPTHPEASNLQGVLHFEDEQMEAAHNCFQRAIGARPDWAAPHNNLGNVHRARLELEAAERCYRQSLDCNPSYVEALTNLGVVLNLKGENATAENYCRKAIDLAPGFAGAHCNLGNVLFSLGRGGEAVAAYREALRLRPGIPESLVNLALIQEDSGYLAGTIDYYEKQLLRQPDNHLAKVRIAQALQALHRWDEARQKLERALELRPDDVSSLFILGVNYVFTGDVRAAIDCWRRGSTKCSHVDAQLSLSAIIFHSMYLEDFSGKQLCSKFRDWAECYATRPLLPQPTMEFAQPGRRLRIGYVSRDFVRHSVAYFLEPILKHHDHANFEVICYSTHYRDDEFTDRFKTYVDNWRDISTMPENKVVDLVRGDGIDILIDLSGHTTGNRLSVFAHKPAPVQVSYLGHPATTGLATIDYRIGDATTDPAELTGSHYVERLWQLPGCFLSYQPPADAPLVTSLPLLERGSVTFGSFNNIAKINDRVIRVWAEILTATPLSRLMLKGFAFSSTRGRDRIFQGFARCGIDLNRIDLVDWRPDLTNHLDLYGEIDIALDTFPYNGTTTSCEALWMGVPVVCLEGERHSARVGASLLAALGTEELLAQDTVEYVRIAVELAGDLQRLEKLRNSLRDRMNKSILLNHAKFTLNLEQAYREMWRSYCRVRTMDEARPESEGAAPAGERTIALDMAGIATICLPDSYEVMTRYVVEEQGDWFEDEIHFVRKMLMPGQTAIDVGANYGVYTLSMAATVGSSGKVFAFEPSETTARQLRESVDVNRFHQIVVIESAVSDIVGRGHFKVETNAELSRLVGAAELNGRDVGVDMTTLDHCRDKLKWEAIDFIKIDAEGQEPHVVRGGRRLLEEFSPLVMAEYKHSQNLNHAVLEEFSNLGFLPYRLIPGLQLLAPVEDVAQVDPYLLNLFFCTDAEVETLSDRGLLAPRDSSRFSARIAGDFGSGWRVYLTSHVYAKDRIDSWNDARIPVGDVSVLNLYAHAQQTGLPPQERLAALTQSLKDAEAVALANNSIVSQLTHARILADFGYRSQAKDLFAKILDQLLYQDRAILDAPFLAPSKRFEKIECRGELKNWVLAAVAEWLASNTGFSSYFTGDESLRYLQHVRQAGYPDVDAQRRIDLILRRRRSRPA